MFGTSPGQEEVPVQLHGKNAEMWEAGGQYFLALMQGIVEHATWFRMKSTALWILRLGKSLAL